MYYIMSENENRILDTDFYPPTEDDLQAQANYYNCAVYVIEGQHYGMSAEPQSEDKEQEGVT